MDTSVDRPTSIQGTFRLLVWTCVACAIVLTALYPNVLDEFEAGLEASRQWTYLSGCYRATRGQNLFDKIRGKEFSERRATFDDSDGEYLFLRPNGSFIAWSVHKAGFFGLKRGAWSHQDGTLLTWFGRPAATPPADATSYSVTCANTTAVLRGPTVWVSVPPPPGMLRAAVAWGSLSQATVSTHTHSGSEVSHLRVNENVFPPPEVDTDCRVFFNQEAAGSNRSTQEPSRRTPNPTTGTASVPATPVQTGNQLP